MPAQFLSDDDQRSVEQIARTLTKSERWKLCRHCQGPHRDWQCTAPRARTDDDDRIEEMGLRIQIDAQTISKLRHINSCLRIALCSALVFLLAAVAEIVTDKF